MKALKALIVILLFYAAVVVVFESLLGYFQPQMDSTMVLTTFAGSNAPEEEGHSRVVQRLESDGDLFVAVNHWPRAWYRQMVRNPLVEVAYGGSTGNYLAVQLEGAEFDRVNSEHPLPLVFRFLTGFPPRHLFRLEPQ